MSSIGGSTELTLEPGESSASSGTSSGTTGGDSSFDTGVPFDIGGRRLPDLVLFASGLRPGDFVPMGGNLDSRGAEICEATLQRSSKPLICDAPPFVIIGTSSRPLPDLVDAHGELETHQFVDPNLELLADDYDALLAGFVERDFGARVTIIDQSTLPTFWWGPSNVEPQDCDGWMASDADGIMRSFVVVPVTDEPRGCGEQHRLLCACVPSA